MKYKLYGKQKVLDKENASYYHKFCNTAFHISLDSLLEQTKNNNPANNGMLICRKYNEIDVFLLEFEGSKVEDFNLKHIEHNDIEYQIERMSYNPVENCIKVYTLYSIDKNNDGYEYVDKIISDFLEMRSEYNSKNTLLNSNNKTNKKKWWWR